MKKSDKYQMRYQAHQAHKRKQMVYSDGSHEFRKWTDKEKQLVQDVIDARRSQRTYNNEELTDSERNEILQQATHAPSSCNRHGISLKVVTHRHEKELLGGLLVGGVGWVHRADTIVLLFADPEAYKSPNEKEFMHYCDVGFTVMPMWYKAESMNIGVAYINPNIRKEFKGIMQKHFGKGIFVGAVALGKYTLKANKSAGADIEDMLL